MRVSYFSLFLLLLVLGSWTFSNAQNCAIPSSISFPEDDDIRIETANTSVILGSVETQNVISIVSLANVWEDFINFQIEDNEGSQIIKLNLKSPLKNELDDKMRKTIECKAELTCADGKKKHVTFYVGIKDQNTKCPVFAQSEYQLTLNLDELYEKQVIITEHIYVTDGDRDITNANVEIQLREELANTGKYLNIHVDLAPSNPSIDSVSPKGIPDDHKFRVGFSLKDDASLYISRGIQTFQLIAQNKQPVLGDNNCTSNSQSSTFVKINFISAASDDPTTEYPVVTPLPHYAGPPVFTNFYYSFTVRDLSDIKKGQLLGPIQPSKLEAKDPDLLHTVKYSIVPGNTSGILDIDPTNGLIFGKKDLTEDYICGLKDKFEVYKIQAFIAETWIKPTMQFSYVPFILIYDLNPEGDYTEAPTTPYGSEIPTKPTESTAEISEGTASTGTTIEMEQPTTTENDEATEEPEFQTTPYTDAYDYTTEHGMDTTLTIPTTTTMTTPTTTIMTTPTTTIMTTPTTTTMTTSTTVRTTTTESIPIVCPHCTIVEEDYACEQPGVFRDANICNIFHQCIQRDSNSTQLLHYKNRCPPYTGFNEELNRCEYPPRCECTPKSAFQRRLTSSNQCPPCQSDCVTCRKVLPGESVCDGSSMLYPDPFRCEVFHSCRTDDQGGYIDCVFDCPDGTVFDNTLKVCVNRTPDNCPYCAQSKNCT